MPYTVGIIGSGRIAKALGRLLLQRGEPIVCIAGRDPLRTRQAAEFIGERVVPVTIEDVPGRASRFLIAVSDGAIGEVAQRLAPVTSPRQTALHTCGARGAEELEPLRLRGVACGTLHPLQTVCDEAHGVAALGGIAYGISGEDAALRWAQELVDRVGGRALRIDAARRPLYHAAAVMASNYVAALTDAAQRLMADAAGCGQSEALSALAPLLRTALENVLERGPVAALTGPIERGDLETVRLHLQALQASPESIARLYRGAGLHTVEVAARKGLPPPAAEELRTILR